MKYLNVTTARTLLLRLVDHLSERIAIMRNSQPVAVLLDFDDYRALVAAQALARDPERLVEMQAIARRFRAGDRTGFQPASAVLAAAPAMPDGDQDLHGSDQTLVGALAQAIDMNDLAGDLDTPLPLEGETTIEDERPGYAQIRKAIKQRLAVKQRLKPATNYPAEPRPSARSRKPG